MSTTYHLKDWTDRYLKLRQAELDPATIKIHRRTCNLLFQYFGNVELKRLSRADAADWNLYLMTELEMSEATRCKHARVAKVIFERALDEERVAVNMFRKLKSTPSHVVHERTLVSELDVMKASIQEPRLKPILMLCYWAGLRRNEAMRLKPEHVDFDNNKIYVLPKAGKVTTKQKRRVVRLEVQLKEYLQELTTYNELKESLLCKLMKGKGFKLQQLRQTRDTIWHDNYPPHVASSWLGHSERVAREHYLSVSDHHYDHIALKKGA